MFCWFFWLVRWPDVNDNSRTSANATLATCHSSLLDSEDSLQQQQQSASAWSQFCILFKRSFICSIRDLTLTRLRLAVHLIVGILVGLLYAGIGNDASSVYSNAAAIFVNQLFMMFTAMMATVLTCKQ